MNDWDNSEAISEAETTLNAALGEEDDDHEAAIYLRGHAIYAIARIIYATLAEYNRTLGIHEPSWHATTRPTQTMLVAVVHGIVSKRLADPAEVHAFCVRFLQSADVKHPDMIPWVELSDEQARKPMLIFGLVITMLASPQTFGAS